MNETITIRSEFDVITARMKVRELARAKNFNITDQARISLATSSLAETLGLGRKRQGTIAIDALDETQRIGIRVICTAITEAVSDLVPDDLKNTGWLIDDLTIEKLPSNDLQVTAIHWATPRRGLCPSP